jgi:peroxiredoxin Q/BCP
VSDSDAPIPGPAKEGAPAPDLTLPSQTGEQVSLRDHRGQWVVLYFYPADDTPGCTAEACTFRDSHEEFVDAGAVVIGVSSDSIEKHVKFAEKHNLPFTLLSDGDGEARKIYGVKKTMGLLPGRVTYVIDPDGVVRKIFSSQLGAKKHHTEALAAIKG